jgi:peptidoglycan/xylan/chitin deacetylase (PgdA/CDA1 family)
MLRPWPETRRQAALATAGTICRAMMTGGRARTPLLAIVALAVAMAAALDVKSGAAAVKKGGAKADSLMGTQGADRLLGAEGNDTLFGKAGPDRLSGGPGGDRLKGGEGRDRMHGDTGSDLLLAKDGSADLVSCGRGSDDIVVVDATDQVSSDCEQVVGLLPGEPASSAAGPGGPAAMSGPPAPPEPTSPGDPPGVKFEELPLAMFPDGHGWTGNGTGTFSDAGPPLVVNNDRSFRITTNGEGDESVATSPPLGPVDLTGSHITMQAQVSFSARLDAVKLRLASGNIDTDYAEATVWETDHDPIILGSTFEFQSLPLGGFEVSGDVDWSEIDRAQIVLTDNATGPVTIYVAGIYAVPTSRQATISFAFDDGYESTFTRGMRKLSAYRYPASAYVIVNSVGDADRLSLEQLYTLRDLHHWEIGGHSLTIASHNHPNGLDDLEPEALKAEMNGLRDWLDEEGFGRTTFAYPKGAAGPGVRRFVKRDYCAGRVTARGPETIPARDDYTIRGWSVNGEDTSVEEIEAAVDEAVADGTWLVLSFHDLVAGESEKATEFSDDGFEEIVDYVRTVQKEGDVKVRTVAGALDSHCS